MTKVRLVVEVFRSFEIFILRRLFFNRVLELSIANEKESRSAFFASSSAENNSG